MRALNCCFFFKFTNLIQTEKKTHVPVTVGFPDYAFNENMHDVLLSQMGCFPDTLFLWQTQKLKNTSLLSLKKKKELLLARFSGKFVTLPAWSIALANWFACMRVCTSAIARVSFTSLHLKTKFNKTIFVFIMGAIVHSTSWSSISRWRNYSKIDYNI